MKPGENTPHYSVDKNDKQQQFIKGEESTTALAPSEEEIDTTYHESTTIKGIEISVAWVERDGGNYEIYFPQITTKDQIKHEDVSDQIIKIPGGKEKAKRVFDFAKAELLKLSIFQRLSPSKVAKIYMKTQAFIKEEL